VIGKHTVVLGLLFALGLAIPDLSKCYASGLYGHLGYRFTDVESVSDSDFLITGYTDYGGYPNRITLKSPTLTFGFGYQWLLGKGRLKTRRHTLATNLNWEYANIGSSGYGGSWRFPWDIELSYQYRLNDAFCVFMGGHYFPGGLEDYEYDYPNNAFMALSAGIGFWTKPKGKHVGIRLGRTFGRKVINADGPNFDGMYVSAEFPPEVALFAILILGAVEQAKSSSRKSSTPNASSSRSCPWSFVKGNIILVDYGEDFKARVVEYGPDLKVRIVDYSTSTAGCWKFVKYGAKYKIRVVEYGEDFTIQFVDYGQGCP
jgi:hypothetical protein